jgi:hypothetical protein
VTVLLDEVESLYEGAVMMPDQWGDQAVVDWAEEVSAVATVDKVSAKHLRRIVRIAGRLQQFWESDSRLHDDGIEWRSRVDIALGPRAWRPMLELAMHLLAETPSEDLFDRVGELFKVVNNAEWMGGVPYDEWLAGNRRN